MNVEHTHNIDRPRREVASLNGLEQLSGTIIRVFAGQSGRLGGTEGLPNHRFGGIQVTRRKCIP